MKVESLEIPGLKLITPEIHRDQRGYFMESFNHRDYEAHFKFRQFVQDNESSSFRGILRGLHFQQPPNAQAKLVRVLDGEVFDVIVDLRFDSPTFGRHVSLRLGGEKKQLLFIPRGFAHGYLVLSEKAVFTYKVDAYFHREAESSLAWNDIKLNIEWPLDESDIHLSSKDRAAKNWEQLPNFIRKEWEE